jgi:metalloendopeptidase OMA1, mitochondrial
MLAATLRAPAAAFGLILCLTAAGCNAPTAEGPGHRSQALALSPEQEKQLGEQAYREVLSKEHPLRTGPEVEQVRRVGQKLATAAAIEPLQREINLRVQGYSFDWEYCVLRNDQVNAFCLPGGKVAVFQGLFRVAQNDAQLATVLGHEIAHALAHHASERIARQQKVEHALRALNTGLGGLDPHDREQLIGLLGAGASAYALKYDRQQESEADHIGLFLMAFAGYDPEEAVRFWDRMAQASRGGRVPEVLSDHPSDANRVAQIRQWVNSARAAKQAYDAGRIAPAGR